MYVYTHIYTYHSQLDANVTEFSLTAGFQLARLVNRECRALRIYVIIHACMLVYIHTHLSLPLC